jgi:hypothetical protein
VTAEYEAMHRLTIKTRKYPANSGLNTSSIAPINLQMEKEGIRSAQRMINESVE